MDPLMVVAFLAFSSLVLLVYLLASGRHHRIAARLQDLSGKARPPVPNTTVARFTQVALPKLGAPLTPTDERERNRLKVRLLHAGLYSRHAMFIFLGVKAILMFAPLAAGVLAGLTGLMSFQNGLALGLFGSAFGMLGPNFWLDWMKGKRQSRLRRALPDALDMVVICLQGGLSLQGAFQRVAADIAMAHPELAAEMAINQREVHLGRSTGEALRQFSERCDIEEMRSLASVVLQSERLGASTAKAMHVYAETLRTKRLQRAEELAHTAGTKMLFPMLLCIFPAILLVVLGPAVFQLMELFSTMNR
jgi:tight adherence protein C